MAKPLDLLDSKILRLQREREVLGRFLPHLPQGLQEPQSVIAHELYGSAAAFHYQVKTVVEAVALLERFELSPCHILRQPPFTSIRPDPCGDRHGIYASVDHGRHELRAFVRINANLARVSVELPNLTFGEYYKSDPQARLNFQMKPRLRIRGNERVQFRAADTRGPHSAPNIVVLWNTKESMHAELEEVYGRTAETSH